MRLEGKKAIVTGASRGLGRAIALAFAREGADVLVNYATREAQAQEVASTIRGMGRNAILCRADVSDTAQIRQMVEVAATGLGRVDILVNNAGITLPKGPLETTEAEWEKVLRTDLTGVFLCSQAVIPGMIAQGGGRIINISSTAAKSGTLSGPAYCAAKGGIIPLTHVMAGELAKYHIRVNVVSSGAAMTGMRVVSKTPSDALIAATPLGRVADAKEIAYAALWLASDESSYVNGANIVVDGGRTGITQGTIPKES